MAHGAITVLNVGRVGLDHQDPSVGVDYGVALAALDLLACVIAPGAAGLDGLDALAVDHRRRRTGLGSASLAINHDKMVVDGLEQALAAKAQEPTLDCRHRRQVLGQQPPGDTAPQQVEDGIEHFP